MQAWAYAVGLDSWVGLVIAEPADLDSPWAYELQLKTKSNPDKMGRLQLPLFMHC